MAEEPKGFPGAGKDDGGSLSIGRGSQFLLLDTRREMKGYTLAEMELEVLSSLNAKALIFFSVGSFLLAFATNFLVELVFSPANTTQASTVMLWTIMLLSALAAAAFFLCGFLELKSRKSTVDRIKRETKLRAAE